MIIAVVNKKGDEVVRYSSEFLPRIGDKIRYQQGSRRCTGTCSSVTYDIYGFDSISYIIHIHDIVCIVDSYMTYEDACQLCETNPNYRMKSNLHTNGYSLPRLWGNILEKMSGDLRNDLVNGSWKVIERVD